MEMKARVVFYLLLSVILITFCSVSYGISVPLNLNAKADPDQRTVHLSWDRVADAAGYNIYHKEATDLMATKINSAPVSDLSYVDSAVQTGRDYLFFVRAVGADGAESADSIGIGAPLMNVATSALVTTNKDNPTSARSIRTGSLVTFAASGDMITYHISYSNLGFSAAKNVRIDFDIPSGTVIAGAPIAKKGPGLAVFYYDKASKAWQSKIGKEDNITKVRLTVPAVISPVKQVKDANGSIDLNVIIKI